MREQRDGLGHVRVHADGDGGLSDERVDAIDAGREDLVKELRREGMPVQKLASSSAMSAAASA